MVLQLVPFRLKVNAIALLEKLKTKLDQRLWFVEYLNFLIQYNLLGKEVLPSFFVGTSPHLCSSAEEQSKEQIPENQPV